MLRFARLQRRIERFDQRSFFTPSWIRSAWETHMPHSRASLKYSSAAPSGTRPRAHLTTGKLGQLERVARRNLAAALRRFPKFLRRAHGEVGAADEIARMLKEVRVVQDFAVAIAAAAKKIPARALYAAGPVVRVVEIFEPVLGDGVALQQRRDQFRHGVGIPHKAFVIIPLDIPIEIDLSEQSAFVVGQVDIGLGHCCDSLPPNRLPNRAIFEQSIPKRTGFASRALVN
jgi:hypothetical protein